MRPSFPAGLLAGFLLAAAVALATGVSAPRPADAEPLDVSDCEMMCTTCQSAARTLDAEKTCWAIESGCCAAQGRRPPGTYVDCACGPEVRR